MIYIKAFIVGLAIPSILLPLILYGAVGAGKPEVLNILILHALPLIWGLWNILFLLFFRWLEPRNVGASYLLMGGLLGLFIAIYGVFGLDLPGLLGVRPPVSYFPLVLVPLVYAFLWRLFIRPLNEAIVMEEDQPLPPPTLPSPPPL